MVGVVIMSKRKGRRSNKHVGLLMSNSTMNNIEVIMYSGDG